jgi:hypothetical protein
VILLLRLVAAEKKISRNTKAQSQLKVHHAKYRL